MFKGTGWIFERETSFSNRKAYEGCSQNTSHIEYVELCGSQSLQALLLFILSSLSSYSSCLLECYEHLKKKTSRAPLTAVSSSFIASTSILLSWCISATMIYSLTSCNSSVAVSLPFGFLCLHLSSSSLSGVPGKEASVK